MDKETPCLFMELKVSVQFLWMRYLFLSRNAVVIELITVAMMSDFVLVLNKSNRIVGSKGLYFALSQIHHENELIKHFMKMCRFLDYIK